MQTDFKELRRRLAVPSTLGDEHKQRLSELARLVAKIQASGGECLRVDLSHYVTDALNTMDMIEAGEEPRDGRRRQPCTCSTG